MVVVHYGSYNETMLGICVSNGINGVCRGTATEAMNMKCYRLRGE